MKNKILTSILLCISIFSFSQVSITVPYQSGQVQVVAQITYDAKISKVDSVRLEASYQDYDEIQNPKVFISEHTVIGKPNSIKQPNSFERRKNIQTFRVVVFLGGKSIAVSNEIQIYYTASNYNEAALDKITNLQAKFSEVNGEKIVTLTWDEVPNAFGYVVGEREWNGEERFIRFQLYVGGSMSVSVKNLLTFKVSGYGIKEYGVIAVNSPYESISEAPFNNVASVKVDVK